MTSTVPSMPLRITVAPNLFAVIRLPPNAPTPPFVSQSAWYSVTRTPDEHSIICCEECIPRDLPCERDFRLLKLEGPLPFTAVGILADLARALANAEVPILAVSTYDTDYLLVREIHLKRATTALKSAGYTVDEQGP